MCDDLVQILATVQVVFMQLDVCAIGDGGTATTPMPRQRKANILVDHVHHRRFQLVDVDMLGVDPAQRWPWLNSSHRS